MGIPADDDDPHLAAFERSRRQLFGIAYRMLGSVADAEELVQEAFLRWKQADFDAVRESDAWLVTVTTRLCIDRLRRAKLEREAYVGQWLPEPLVTAEWRDPGRTSELASDLSIAFLLLLERLAPEERASFLMREVFECDYGEIAGVLGKSEAACRQMVHRARERVQRARPRFTVPPAAQERLVERFIGALTKGDREELLALFAENATWATDGGGKVTAARRVLTGADRIARFLVGLERKYPMRRERWIEWLNGEPAVVVSVGGRIFSATSFATDGSRIQAAYSVLNPDKLRSLAMRSGDRN